MANITLYGTPISTYVRTVRLLLEEAGVEYRLQPVDIFSGETKSPEYRAKHPFGKVPALEINGAVIYETSAITGYLNTVIASNRFSPSDPLQLARMHQLMGVIDNYLYVPAIRAIVIQRLVVPSQGRPADEALVSSAIAPTQTALAALEALTVGNPYLLGSDLSIADFYLIPIFVYLSQTPEFEGVTAQTPKLRTWWETARQLPTVKKVCAL